VKYVRSGSNLYLLISKDGVSYKQLASRSDISPNPSNIVIANWQTTRHDGFTISVGQEATAAAMKDLIID